MRYRNPFLWTSLYVPASILSNPKVTQKQPKVTQKQPKAIKSNSRKAIRKIRESIFGCFFAHISFEGNQQLMNLDQTKHRPN